MTGWRPRALLVAGLAGSWAASASAAGADVRPGERVRLGQDGVSIRGTVATLDESGLVVKLEGGTSVTVSRSALETVEVSRGTRHHAAWGAIAGAVAGLAAASLSPTECHGFAFSSDSCKRKNGLAIGALGAATGALIGRTIKVEKWERVGGRRPRLRISMPKGGLGAQVKVKW